jgi:uncharacterized protein (TIGR00255 family)
MIRSMTGTGRAETVLPQRKVKLAVEIRSSNHKFMELNMKLPTPLLGYESNIREIISGKIFRGALQLSINIQGVNGSKNSVSNNSNYERALTLDYEMLANILDLSKELKEKYKVSGELNVNTVMSLPGVVVPAKAIEQNKNKEVWVSSRKTIIKALSFLNRMKEEEGAFLFKDFSQRIKTILRLLKNIEKRSRKIRQELQVKILPNTEQGAQLELLNASRATTEELVRLSSHTRAFLRAIQGKKVRSVGRKLEFILSEMLRETETILAKGRDTLISRDGIAIKEEVDALREQVRNVE